MEQTRCTESQEQDTKDTRLLEQFHAGNARPFLDEFEPLLRRSLSAWRFAEHDADDVLQEVWMQLLRNPPPRKSVRSWLVSITRHVASEWRRRRPDIQTVPSDRLEDLPEWAAHHEDRGIITLIHTTVSQLSADQQELYRRFFEQGASLAQLSKEIRGLCVSRSTIEGRLKLLRRAIADALYSHPSKLSSHEIQTCLFHLAQGGVVIPSSANTESDVHSLWGKRLV